MNTGMIVAITIAIILPILYAIYLMDKKKKK
jgi:hypothetical protein